MNEKIALGIIILCVSLLSGCIDTTGYEECFESYDNLILEGGWEIIEHTSDFVSGAENRYFIVYKIQCYANCTLPGQTKYVSGFVYDSENDKLFYSSDGLTPDLPEEVLDWI